MVDLPHINQVYMIYLARLRDDLAPAFSAGPESLEVRLFSEDDIPWSEIAFSTITTTLECYFRDRSRLERDALDVQRLELYSLHADVIRRW